MTRIHPSAIVHKDVELADDVEIGPYCIIHKGVSIAEGTILDSNVVIEKNVTIGSSNRFFPNCVIGCRPQVMRLASDAEYGRLVIGSGNVIREQVTIHAALTPDKQTVIGNNNFLMVNVHIGHDCIIEDNVVMSNLVQIAGHCKIETGAWFSGMAGSHQFVTFGKWSYAAGLAGINRDIPPFMMVSGHYPPEVRSVNKRGLVRAGLDEQQQEKICEAFRKIYRGPGTLLENTAELAKQNGLDENVQAIIEAITNSSKHQYGRYLETFRD
jgi:UDP-N-acetylglucosamine acyltransferase